MTRQKTIETKLADRMKTSVAAFATLLPLCAGCLRYEMVKPVQNQPRPTAQATAFASWKVEQARRAVLSGAAAMIIPRSQASAPASEPIVAMPKAEFKQIIMPPFKPAQRLTELKPKAKSLLYFHESPAARFEQIENTPKR